MHINIGFLKLNIGGRYCVAKGFRFLWQVHFSFRAEFVLLKFYFWNSSYPLFAFSRRRVVSSSLTAFRFQKSFFFHSRRIAEWRHVHLNFSAALNLIRVLRQWIFYFLNLKSFFNFELFLYQRIPQKNNIPHFLLRISIIRIKCSTVSHWSDLFHFAILLLFSNLR